MTNSFVLLAIPWHIQHEVFKYMDPISRISLRQCSKRIRRIVNECEPCYKSIDMSLRKDTVRLTLITDSGQEEVVNYRREAVDNEENCVSEEDYIQRSVIDFSGIVANPKVTVDSLMVGRPFEVYFGDDVEFQTYPDEEIRIDVRVLIQCIGEQMNVLGEQMKVKSLISTIEVPQDYLMTLLSAIKPVILEKMEIVLWSEENLDRVTATEQWNRAREVDLVKMRDGRGMRREPMIDDPHEVPLEKLLHFRKVSYLLRWLVIEEAEKIIEAAIRQGDEFISFHIGACFTTRATRDLIQQLINRQNPDSQLEFRVTKYQFHVDRKQPIEQVAPITN